MDSMQKSALINHIHCALFFIFCSCLTNFISSIHTKKSRFQKTKFSPQRTKSIRHRAIRHEAFMCHQYAHHLSKNTRSPSFLPSSFSDERVTYRTINLPHCPTSEKFKVHRNKQPVLIKRKRSDAVSGMYI